MYVYIIVVLAKTVRKFRYLPHTADVAFVGYGTDLKSALSNAALALLNTMLDLKAIEKDAGAQTGLTIRESAHDYDELAWFVLQDILSKVDARKLNAFRFDVLEIKEAKGTVKLSGRLAYKKSKSDYALLSVKAVTPHNLHVRHRGNSCSITVVVDV